MKASEIDFVFKTFANRVLDDALDLQSALFTKYCEGFFQLCIDVRRQCGMLQHTFIIHEKPWKNKVFTFKWCLGLDSNQHSIATVSTSSWCVYQFHHPGIAALSITKLIFAQEKIGHLRLVATS